MVMLADDAYVFMVMWELMALSSFFLVTANHLIPEIRRAGYLYLLVAHIGALAILLCFGVLQGGSGGGGIGDHAPDHPLDGRPLSAMALQRAIDSARGRAIYSQRIATVEPVFANIRHHKGMRRFTLRGKTKVATQWQLYCLVHNIEKIAHSARC